MLNIIAKHHSSYLVLSYLIRIPFHLTLYHNTYNSAWSHLNCTNQ